MPSFFIYGSCVSRDAFTPGRPEAALAGYVARYSIARLPAPASPPLDVSAIASGFQRRMVETELANGLDQALAAPFDFLLLDFIDDRLGLIELAPGVVATHSNELVSSGLVPNGAKKIPHGPGEFMERWTQGLGVLSGLVRARGLQDRVLVNRVRWADSLSDGRPVSAAIPYMAGAFIAERNAVLDEQYRLAAELLRPRFLDYPGECFVGDVSHKWGISPFHYVPQFYEAQYAHLRALV